MRDAGLERAAEAAGGISRLARGLGIAQPSVSSWRRVPAERVLEVEALTGVARGVLRPDLYPAEPLPDVGLAGTSSGPAMDAAATVPASWRDAGGGGRLGDLDEVEAARAAEYGLLGALLLRAPDADLLASVAALDGDASVMGLAHAELAKAAADTTASAVEREYFALFIGLGRGEIVPYASYYLTGFLHERPLARLRADMARLGIAAAAGRNEPEDHLGSLCEIMAGLIRGELGTGPENASEVYERHLAGWAPRLFTDLEQARSAVFYRSVGRLGRIFLEIEAEARALPEVAA